MPAHPNGQAHAHEPAARRGLLIAFEGGEGAGKTTQARLLAIWLREQGYDVIATHEPGATKVGMRLRALLLDTAHTGLSARAETLMYAADRAEHVDTVIEPALKRGWSWSPTGSPTPPSPIRGAGGTSRSARSPS